MSLSKTKTDFSNLRLLVLGDIILDEFVYANTHRMSPEHPVPVYAVEKSEYYPGGAANVAANIIALGGQVELLSVIGKDKEAAILLDLLNMIDCRTENLFISETRQTSHKARLFSSNEAIARIDNESTQDLSEDISKQLLQTLDAQILDEQIDGIILQDYNKGVLTQELIRQVINSAKKRAVPVFVDPKINNYDAYNGSTIFKPNLNELTEILGYRPDLDLNSLDKAAKKLQTYVEHDTLVLTLSEKGAYFSNGMKSGIIPTHTIQNADVCGAGDSFIAALSLCLCNNLDLEEAISFANKASYVVCSKQGVRTCHISEI